MVQEIVDERQNSGFAAVNEAIRSVEERQNSRFAAVDEAISSLDERTQRGFAAVNERITTESSETRAMIRLSYTELDRRLRSLEDRVERLEQSVH